MPTHTHSLITETSLSPLFILSLTAPLILFLSLSLFSKIIYFKKIFTDNRITSCSAGLIMGLTFLHFIPHSLEHYTPFNFSVTLLITLSVLLIIETHLIPKMDFLHIWLPSLKNKQTDCSHYHQYHHHLSHSSSFSAIGCMLICSFLDGIRLGSALLIDITTTSALMIALFAHILPEGILVINLARSSAVSLRTCFYLQGIFCLLFGLGIVSTGLTYVHIPNINILALSSASLLYVCFIHLLPIALQKGNQKWFFISLLTMSLLSLTFSH